MKKKLGFYSIVLLTINSIIGTGIFLSPGSVVKSAGDKALLVYFLAAIFAAVLAVTFASASKYVAKGGAAYAYAKAAFGKDVGFYVGITRFMAASIAWGVMGTAVVKTVMSMFKIDTTNLAYVTIGFVVLMGVLFVINILGTKFLEFISNLSTIGKVGALVTTIIVGIVIVMMGTNNFDKIKTVTDKAGVALGANMDLSAWVMAIIAAFYAFTGFESVASGSQDMEQPEKNLPRAIPLAIGIIAAIYIGIVGIAMMMNPVELVKTKEVVALAAVFNDPTIRGIIVAGALVSMFGINVAASFHTPRVLEAMASEKQIPAYFTKRAENGFPIRAFLITIAIAILLPMAFSYDMTNIMILSSISRFIQFLVVPVAVLVFYFGKQKEEIIDAKKNFVLDVVVPLCALALTVLLLYKFNWTAQFTTVKNGVSETNYFAITAMLLGYVVLPVALMIYNKVTKKA